jgi:hypothetical protein
MNNLIVFDANTPPEDLEKLGFTEKGKENFKSYVFEASMWASIANSITPPELVEMREGYYDTDTGKNVDLEYFPEEYTLTELNRLFPGWWTTKMKRSQLEEVIKLETILVEGYLMIPYATPVGAKVRKIWAIAGSSIKFKSGTKIPVDIGNGFKGARTEWLRVAGKWLGIGLDIYHQHILPGLRSLFEDRIRTWSIHATHWKKVAGTCNTGQEFRTMLKTMPSERQIERIAACLPYIPEAKHPEILSNFGKLSNKNDVAKKQFEEWLIVVETISEKNRIKKEGKNGDS